MKILVIEARYYESISEDLLKGALAKLQAADAEVCLLYTSPSPRDQRGSRMPSSA